MGLQYFAYPFLSFVQITIKSILILIRKACLNFFLNRLSIIEEFLIIVYPWIALIPGRIFPSIASSNAPPPVDTYDTPFAKPNLLTQATESPPPTRENAPFLVASTIASPTEREPWVKFSNSNTPVGPFQRIVLDFLITSANIFSPFRFEMPYHRYMRNER